MAINLVTIVDEAFVGTNSVVELARADAGGDDDATSPGDQKHVLLADATSGAGGGKVAIAGSLGLTIADVKTTAE